MHRYGYDGEKSRKITNDESNDGENVERGGGGQEMTTAF